MVYKIIQYTEFLLYYILSAESVTLIPQKSLSLLDTTGDIQNSLPEKFQPFLYCLSKLEILI